MGANIMSDTETPQPEPAPKARRSPASQDQAQANRLNEYRQWLTAGRANADLVSRMSPRGFDDAGLAEGLGRCDTAQAAFNARQAAKDALSEAAKEQKRAESEARNGYAAFRKIATPLFKDNATAKAALIVSDRQLDDVQKFLTTIETVYTTALSRVTYLQVLKRRGYDEAGVQAELAKLKVWTQARAGYLAADEAAQRAKAERDAAMKALDAWWAEFKAVAEVTLKDRSDLSGLLGL
jgi:hypothetical protein